MDAKTKKEIIEKIKNPDKENPDKVDTDKLSKLTEEKPKEKRKRGRPRKYPVGEEPYKKKKSEQPKEVFEEIPEELIKAFIGMPYEIIANRYGEHWRLSENEIEQMVGPHQRVINKYLPEFLKKHADLIAIVYLHGVAIGMRYRIQRQIDEEEKKKETTQ